MTGFDLSLCLAHASFTIPATSSERLAELRAQGVPDSHLTLSDQSRLLFCDRLRGHLGKHSAAYECHCEWDYCGARDDPIRAEWSPGEDGVTWERGTR